MCLCSEDEKIWKPCHAFISSPLTSQARFSVRRGLPCKSSVLVCGPVLVSTTRTHSDNIIMQTEEDNIPESISLPLPPPPRAPKTISLCIHYVSDSEARRGRDKEDLLCSMRCRPWALKQGSSPAEHSQTNTTKPRLLFTLCWVITSNSKTKQNHEDVIITSGRYVRDDFSSFGSLSPVIWSRSSHFFPLNEIKPF